jgi:hypothetical protein
MDELKNKIEELKLEIMHLGVEVCNLLDYGNVPEANFEAALNKLQERAGLRKSLELMSGLQADIEHNLKQTASTWE